MIHNSKLNKLIKSIVALGLILVLFVTATFTWLSANVATNIDTSEFITISADAGLNMNYGYGDNNQGQMSFPEGCILKECSSADGRSLYFPLPAYGRNDQDFADTNDIDFTDGIEYNSDLLFREATAIDKNKSYISLDLELSSEDNSSVWLDRSSYIKNTNSGSSAQAIRVAFIEKKPDGKSIVFDNSPDKDFSESVFKNYTLNGNDKYYLGTPYFNPVSSINRKGESTTQEAIRPYSFNEFVQGNSDGNILFNLKAGETLYVTVNIWLEGTDPECTTSALNLEDLDIFIKFSTSYESMRTFYFKDYTLEKWVANDDCFVFAQDKNDNLYPFTKSANYNNDYTWYGDIPESVTDVKFVRYNPEIHEGTPQEWNYWEAGAVGDCNTFSAYAHGAGIWSDSFSPTVITLLDGSPEAFMCGNTYDNTETAMVPTIMHASYTLEDANGNNVTQSHKLSYHHQKSQWQVVIPSQVTDIDFCQYQTVDFEDSTLLSPDEPMFTWNTSRGNNLYYTMNFDENHEPIGYWSNEFIYVKDNGYKGYDAIIAAYFRDQESTDFGIWTAMRAKTDNGNYKAAVPPELMASNNIDQNPDTATVYFTNTDKWATPHLYYFNPTTNLTSGLQWPGTAMTKAYTNTYGQDVYKLEVPHDQKGLIFTAGISGPQTVDITPSELYDGMGYYLTERNVNWNVATYTSYKSAVIITRYPVLVEDNPVDYWEWDLVYNQVSSDLEVYGTNNLLTLEGYTTDSKPKLKGTWSNTDNP